MSKRHKLSSDERRAVWNAMNRRCAYCGMRIKLEDMCIDHIRPLALGGRDTCSNMACACWQCNQLKADKTVAEFRDDIQHGTAELFRDNGIYRTMLRYNQVKETRRRVVFYFEKKQKEGNGEQKRKRKKKY